MLKQYYNLLIFALVATKCYAYIRFDTIQQDWGFIDVRPGAHMFYWLYYTTADVDQYTERPLIIWIDGGPGTAGSIRNFANLGPIDFNGNYRNTTWIQHFNLLFIDNPVGTGFSYVDNDSLYATSNEIIALDLVVFMKEFYERHNEFINIPLHIFGVSYAGKMAPAFALALHEAKERNELQCNLQSLVLGNPLVSLLHTLKSKPAYLFQIGLIDFDQSLVLEKVFKDFERNFNAKNFNRAYHINDEFEFMEKNMTYHYDNFGILV